MRPCGTRPPDTEVASNHTWRIEAARAGHLSATAEVGAGDLDVVGAAPTKRVTTETAELGARCILPFQALRCVEGRSAVGFVAIGNDVHVHTTGQAKQF